MKTAEKIEALQYDGVGCPMCGAQTEDTKDGDACPTCGPIAPMTEEWPEEERFPFTAEVVPMTGPPAGLLSGIMGKSPWQEGGNRFLDMEQKVAKGKKSVS